MISLPKLFLIHFQGVSSLSVIEVMFCGKLLSCSHLTATIKRYWSCNYQSRLSIYSIEKIISPLESRQVGVVVSRDLHLFLWAVAIDEYLCLWRNSTLLKLVFSLLLHWICLHCFLRQDQDIFFAAVLHKYTKQKQSFQARDNGDVLQYQLNQQGPRCSLLNPVNKNHASLLSNIILNELGVNISRSQRIILLFRMYFYHSK